MRNARGFSAIEVLVALTITAVALLAIIGMFPSAYSNVDRSGDDTVALTLAQQRIELLKNQPYASVAAATESSIPGYAGYTRTTTIGVDTPISGIKQVTVQVDSPEGRRVQLVTLITK